MKKLKLNLESLQGVEVLSRKQMKDVAGGLVTTTTTKSACKPNEKCSAGNEGTVSCVTQFGACVCPNPYPGNCVGV